MERPNRESAVFPANYIAFENDNIINQPIVNNPPNEKIRLACLDIFRGLSVIGMVVVNNGGGNSRFSLVEEAHWNGLLPGDCIFPSFLFIMGFSLTLASANDSKAIWAVIRRFLILLFLGLIMNFFDSFFDIFSFRIPGVFQRLAICYLLIAIFHFYCRITVQLIILSIFIIVYSYFTYFFPVPGCGMNNVTENCFAGTYIDIAVFGRSHIYTRYEPEGILSTLTAFYLTYFGYIFGLQFKRVNAEYITIQEKRLKTFFIWTLYVLLNLFLFLIFRFALDIPINKKVFSLSFANIQVVISGCSLLFFYTINDIYKEKLKFIGKIFIPIVWFGLNPFIVYISSQWLGIILQALITIKGESLWNLIFYNLYLSWIKHEKWASLLFASTILLLMTLLVFTLNRFKIYIRL